MAKHNSLDGLIKWSQREEWDDLFGEVLDMHFGQVCEDHDIDFGKLPELIGHERFAALWGCAFEDFLTRPRSEESEETIVDDYLKRRGWKEAATNRRYMEALRDSLTSLYEVSEIVPGQSILLRDLVLGGDPVRVIEHSATQSLKPWDRIGARVVQVSGQYRISGGLLLFRPEVAMTLLEEMQADMKRFRREFKKQAKASGVEDPGLVGKDAADLVYLVGAAPMFSGAWLDHALFRLLGDANPTVLNADGDALSFHTARFPFAPAATAESLRARLNDVAELVAAGDDFWNWVEAPAAGPAGKKQVKVHSLVGNAVGVNLEDGSKVLGSVELQEGALVLETNSSRRAAFGSDLLKSELGSLLGKPQVTARSLDELRQQSGDAPASSADKSLPPEEEEAAMRQVLENHYRSVLDEPLPLLGDVTPRAAAKTKAGQRKLVEWLKYLENQTAKATSGGRAASYDFGWMWQELGISHLRK